MYPVIGVRISCHRDLLSSGATVPLTCGANLVTALIAMDGSLMELGVVSLPPFPPPPIALVDSSSKLLV